ncbi:hypothetical protein [Methanoregula sp. UBA64]|uniref:hypothetical protein n=1 Tax=Methanoregula sp. UBA64 TaxID=1915554 RepID=UPI0025F1E5B0|nr:hypothetical protein [Methanoregula sp. UBA64]
MKIRLRLDLQAALPDVQKKSGKVAGLSKKSSAGLSGFCKKVRQRWRRFQKKFNDVTGLFKKSSRRLRNIPEKIPSNNQTSPHFHHPRKSKPIIHPILKNTPILSPI